MSDYDDMLAMDNLTRAYRWIRTNSEGTYKNLFRDNYSAFALASQSNLEEIHFLLKNQKYSPTEASKVFFPKASGTLRPYTLLTVSDQVVYQACVNIIAEKLSKKISKRKGDLVFHHIYAGKQSLFFYKKWDEQYKKYTHKIIKTFYEGKKWSADFDLTSFYDTIDHRVLERALRDIGIDNELIKFLTSCLHHWTSIIWTTVTNAIFHGHGIPQGPISSGMLSEVILRYLDERGARTKKIIYVRYVDDIRIFAKTQVEVRKRLISLDIESKNLGLFPQTSKINVREIENIEEEIKSISLPEEEILKVDDTSEVDQKKLIPRLLQLSKGCKIKKHELTRFKYLLSLAASSDKLSLRLIRLLENNPDLSKPISSYFSKIEKISKTVSLKILDFLNGDELYHSVHADLLNACKTNLPDIIQKSIENFSSERLALDKIHESSTARLQPTYKVELIWWALKGKKFSYSDFVARLKNENDWWVRQKMVSMLNDSQFGRPTYKQILIKEFTHKVSDIAMCAATKFIEEDLGDTVRPRGENFNPFAEKPLILTNRLDKAAKRPSLIPEIFQSVFRHKLPSYDWLSFYGKKHHEAEQLALKIKAASESDPEKCICLIDSLNDLTFEIIYTKFKPTKKYKKTAYGSMLDGCTNDIGLQFPDLYEAFCKIHDLRGKSRISHPRDKKGRPTKTLTYRQLDNVRKKLGAGYENIVLYIN